MRPYAEYPDATLYVGDCRAVLADLPAQSVQAVVTSPPYWGLRRYEGVEPTLWDVSDPTCEHEWGEERTDDLGSPQGATGERATRTFTVSEPNTSRGQFCRHCSCWRGCLGLEPSITLYVAHLVDVFAAVKRVLRDDGICWVNLGDSYNAGTSAGHKPSLNVNHGYWENGGSMGDARVNARGLPSKNLCLVPERFALAAQADGWYVRQREIGCKVAPMPESVTDRSTSALEHVWMLTKSERYFYDAEAGREAELIDHPSGNGYARDYRLSYDGRGQENQGKPTGQGRNRRNWFLWHPDPFSGAHFAVFPRELARRYLVVSTPEAGCCAACGAPWKRQIRASEEYAKHLGKGHHVHGNDDVAGMMQPKRDGWKSVNSEYVTLGFLPSCACDASTVPSPVLDIFGGSGTVAVVARELNRRSIYIDASPTYARMAVDRLAEVTPSLPLHAAPVLTAAQLSLEATP